MVLLPKFRRLNNGELLLKSTQEADEYFKKKEKPFDRSQPLEQVEKDARKSVEERNGDVNNRLDVLGEYIIQFGGYRGKTFRWLLENYLGYAVYIADSSSREKQNKSAIGCNKTAFVEYVNNFKDVREEVAKRRAREEKKAQAAKEVTETGATSTSTPSVSALASGHMTPSRYLACKTQSKFKPNIPPPRTPRTKSTPTCTQVTVTSTPRPVQSDDDQELCAVAEHVEREKTATAKNPSPSKCVETATKSTQTPKQVQQQQPQTSNSTVFGPEEVESNHEGHSLPEGWKKSMPKEDHVWVAKALFKTNPRTGKAEMDFDRVNKLWWDPPEPPLICSQVPRPDNYFGHRLLVWMPRKLWLVKLFCPHQGCEKKELTSAGIYHTVRQVLHIDGYYNLAAEYLECRNCKRKVISWSPAIVKQLDYGHQIQFPVLLTYQYACDVRVITMLRERSQGNSSTQLQKKLTEVHGEMWMKRAIKYLTECKYFSDAARKGLVSCPAFQELPKLQPLPKYKWFLTVYALDIMSRLDHIKASITSTFGNILKMNSTKKIVKKLSGHGAGTASWATNIGNEKGQVLMSVLTASEGVGLGPMANGLMRRYSMAGVPPPEVLYVDRDCCGGMGIKTKEMFSLWDKLVIRLDIWHFMRCLAAGCNTKAHPLYSVFLSRLSQCIFEWSKEDLELLKSAKKTQMKLQGIRNPSDADVIARISRKEFALHCRRKTRGEAEMTRLIHNLLETFTGDQGCDTLGVPLMNHERMWEIWNSQKHHIPCLQDPEGVQLYVQTGTLIKGTVTLPTYRCARGSTSLESFHLHINRFIPGTSASDWHFQAYLLEGLTRWNADRAASAVSGVSTGPGTYSRELCQNLNNLSTEVYGRETIPDVQQVGIYTGEKIGVEYLYSQTGQVLENRCPEEDEDQIEEPLSDVDQLDEGFLESDDYTLPTVDDVYLMPDNENQGMQALLSTDHPNITTGKGRGKIKAATKQQVIAPKPNLLAVAPNPPTVAQTYMPLLLPGTSQPVQFVVQQHQPIPAPHALPLPPLLQPQPTRISRKRKIEDQPRKKIPRCCGLCGQPKEPPTHRQYFGNWYCPNSAQVTYEVWLEELKSRTSYKKKRQ